MPVPTYPMTKMNFLVTLGESTATAAFTEVSGIDSTVEVIEFRQGNSPYLTPVKIPGLVKHGNITLKYGVSNDLSFITWVIECIKDAGRNAAEMRKRINIELINIVNYPSPSTTPTTGGEGKLMWTLDNCWVTKYTGPDLNASTSEVAMETVEIAYERMTIIDGIPTD